MFGSLPEMQTKKKLKSGRLTSYPLDHEKKLSKVELSKLLKPQFLNGSNIPQSSPYHLKTSKVVSVSKIK